MQVVSLLESSVGRVQPGPLGRGDKGRLCLGLQGNSTEFRLRTRITGTCSPPGSRLLTTDEIPEDYKAKFVPWLWEKGQPGRKKVQADSTAALGGVGGGRGAAGSSRPRRQAADASCNSAGTHLPHRQVVTLTGLEAPYRQVNTGEAMRQVDALLGVCGVVPDGSSLESLMQALVQVMQSMEMERTRSCLDVLYSVMQSVEGRLGGGEGVEGIYGSITLAGMRRIYDCMKHNCGFDSSSTLVDVGAGLGRPLLHALMEPGARGAFGIELDAVKVRKADAFLMQTLAELKRRDVSPLPAIEPAMMCQSVEEVPSLDPATHAYSFWEGVPQSGKAAFGRLFAASRTLKAVTVVQRSMRNEDPAQLMQTLGFGPLLLISNFVVKMSGSGCNFQAYVFSKIKPQSLAFISRVLPPAAAAPTTVCGQAASTASEAGKEAAAPGKQMDGAPAAAAAAAAAVTSLRGQGDLQAQQADATDARIQLHPQTVQPPGQQRQQHQQHQQPITAFARQRKVPPGSRSGQKTVGTHHDKSEAQGSDETRAMSSAVQADVTPDAAHTIDKQRRLGRRRTVVGRGAGQGLNHGQAKGGSLGGVLGGIGKRAGGALGGQVAGSARVSLRLASKRPQPKMAQS